MAAANDTKYQNGQNFDNLDKYQDEIEIYRQAPDSQTGEFESDSGETYEIDKVNQWIKFPYLHIYFSGEQVIRIYEIEESDNVVTTTTTNYANSKINGQRIVETVTYYPQESTDDPDLQPTTVREISTWVDGSLNGPFQQIDESGIVVSGDYKDDMKNGIFNERDSVTGKIVTNYYINDILTDPSIAHNYSKIVKLNSDIK